MFFVSRRSARLVLVSAVLGVLTLVVTASTIAGADARPPVATSAIQLSATYTVGYGPDGVAYNSYNHEVYVSNSQNNSVYALNSSTGTIRYTIAVGPGPGPIVYDPANHDVYVANYGGSTVSIIGPKNTAPKTLTVGSDPDYLCYNPANKEVYVSVYGVSNVVAIANKTYKMTVITGFSNPDALVYDTATKEVYVQNYNNSVAVVSNSNKISAWIGVDATGNFGTDFPAMLAYDPVNQTVWSTAYFSNTVDVLKGNSFITRIGLPSGPESVAYDPANGLMFVTDESAGYVTMINATTYQVAGSLPVGSLPTNLLYDSVNQQMYVAVYGSNWVVAILDSSVNVQLTFVSVGVGPDTIFYSSVQSTVWALDLGGDTISVVSS